MFWTDVVALKAFYATTLGKWVEQVLAQQVRRFWPDGKDEVLLGVGFSQLLFTPYLDEAERVLVCMPSEQGVIHWPPQKRNLTMLAHEDEIPLPDNSVHKVLLLHAMEHSEHVREMLSEIWRILAPGGRVLAIVPNRRGIWARSPSSPFAHGYPYTSAQLKEVFVEHSFTPLNTSSALFFLPSERSYILKLSRVMEFIGRFLCPAFGGLLLMESEKRIYAPVMQKTARRFYRRYVPVGQVASVKDRL